MSLPDLMQTDISTRSHIDLRLAKGLLSAAEFGDFHEQLLLILSQSPETKS